MPQGGVPTLTQGTWRSATASAHRLQQPTLTARGRAAAVAGGTGEWQTSVDGR
jgi:hypothetical protein